MFTIDQTQQKLMTKFFNKLKKTLFLAIFGPFSQFWRQKIFFRNILFRQAQPQMGF